MKKYFLEEIKNFILQMVVGTVVVIGMVLFVLLIIHYPILLIPILLGYVLHYLWQRAKISYKFDKETDEVCLRKLYMTIYHDAVLYKEVNKVEFDTFQKAFKKYCEKYPKDTETIERYTRYCEDLKRMFKSLDTEG